MTYLKQSNRTLHNNRKNNKPINKLHKIKRQTNAGIRLQRYKIDKELVLPLKKVLKTKGSQQSQ